MKDCRCAAFGLGSGYAMGMAYGICEAVCENSRYIANLMRWRSLPFFCAEVRYCTEPFKGNREDETFLFDCVCEREKSNFIY